MSILERIERLYAVHGHRPYPGARREAVTAQEHALQCAQLAEWAHADDTLVAAAFLHDIGHLLATDAVLHDERIDDRHETVASQLLAPEFGTAVSEPVRLHVQAKRYLVATDERYAAGLSPASVHSLQLQGGPMDRDERLRFDTTPFSREALMLRRWDDLAKEPGRRTPPIAWYLSMLSGLRVRAAPSAQRAGAAAAGEP